MKRQKDISSYFSKQAATVSSRPKLGQAGHSTAVSELSATVLCPAPAAVLHPAIATANASTDFDDPPTVAMAPTAVGPLADAVVTTAPSAVARPAVTAALGDIFDVSDIGYAVGHWSDRISVPEEHARQYLDKATWRPPAHFCLIYLTKGQATCPYPQGKSATPPLNPVSATGIRNTA